MAPSLLATLSPHSPLHLLVLLLRWSRLEWVQLSLLLTLHFITRVSVVMDIARVRVVLRSAVVAVAPLLPIATICFSKTWPALCFGRPPSGFMCSFA